MYRYANPALMAQLQGWYNVQGQGMEQADLLGAEDYELDGIDNEIDVLGQALDWLAEDDYMIGAKGAGLSGRIARLEAKLARIEDKASTARTQRKRDRLSRKAGNIREKIERLKGKLDGKLSKAVRKGSMQPATAAAIAAGAGVGGAGAGYGIGQMMHQGYSPLTGATAPGVALPANGPAMQGYAMQEYPAGQFSGNVPPSQLVNQVQRSPSAGEEIRLPLLVGGSPVVVVNIPAGAGLRTVDIVAETRLIPYAGFQVTGIDFEINAQPNADSLVNALISNFSVSGDKNLLYDTEAVGFAGQTRGGPDGTGRRTIAGIRENQILQPTNTITATAQLRQEITNAADINLTVQAAAIVRSIWDPAVRR